MENWGNIVPSDIREKYELYNVNHAVEILFQAYPAEYHEILESLRTFKIQTKDILSGGGSESQIPKHVSELLRPKGWNEIQISADLLVKLHNRQTNELTEKTIKNFLSGHNIDYVKNKVALDLEWNSKDQTFDRDLYAMRTFYECGVISCGVIVTRSEKLNPIFSKLGIKQKYGASTTFIGKLLPRIQSGRHGGCPLLIVGITPAAIVDLEA